MVIRNQQDARNMLAFKSQEQLDRVLCGWYLIKRRTVSSFKWNIQKTLLRIYELANGGGKISLETELKKILPQVIHGSLCILLQQQSQHQPQQQQQAEINDKFIISQIFKNKLNVVVAY